jgi:predicted phosphodiesterase
MILLISDVHGKWDRLNKLIEENKDTQIIQLGDLGIGFQGFDYPESFPDNFRFIRGNHDNPEVCREHPNYLGDYGQAGDLFYISGAYSLDHALRSEGVDWWPEEQLSYQELQNMIDLYVKVKPKYVISHDCPDIVCTELYGENRFPNRTQQALQVCIEEHQPHKWVFGHHHVDYRSIMQGTEFICRKELGTYILK